MNAFIIGSPLETAMALDKRRLNKQIVECLQMLNAMEYKSRWSNHPCTLQYREHKHWLFDYMQCLDAYRNGDIKYAESISARCDLMRPSFQKEEFFNQMKRRLYTKNNKHYKQWEHLGESNQNWYFVYSEIIVYENGKRLK